MPKRETNWKAEHELGTRMWNTSSAMAWYEMVVHSRVWCESTLDAFALCTRVWCTTLISTVAIHSWHTFMVAFDIWIFIFVWAKCVQWNNTESIASVSGNHQQQIEHTRNCSIYKVCISMTNQRQVHAHSLYHCTSILHILSMFSVHSNHAAAATSSAYSVM